MDSIGYDAHKMFSFLSCIVRLAEVSNISLLHGFTSILRRFYVFGFFFFIFHFFEA